MEEWHLTSDEYNIILSSLKGIIDYLAKDESIEMVFVSIKNPMTLMALISESDEPKDFVINAVSSDRHKVSLGDETFPYLKDIQTKIPGAFAYFVSWDNDEDTLNHKMFRDLLSRSFLIVERGNSHKYIDLYESLQSDPTFTGRSAYYIDFTSSNLLVQKSEMPKLLARINEEK